MKNKQNFTSLMRVLAAINEGDTIPMVVDIEYLTSNTEKIMITLDKIEYRLQHKPPLFEYYASPSDVENALLFIHELISSNLYLTDVTDFNILEYYFKIYNKFGIKTISKVTANKCIVDPLGNPISDIANIRIDVSEVNDWMLNELNKNPTDLYQLSSRRFEEFIAEIFIRKGYDVELTPATHDDGKDIYVASKNDLGSFLYVVECKKYKSSHKVGVNVLRDLYGVLSKEKATYGIAVTTSYFSKPAKEFQQELQFQMSLKDFDSIKQWLHDVI